MSKGRLADQMGAMALVDDLRHRRREIEEHLDLPKREAEVAERIRVYYKSQGIDCDDALVNEGVREFFRHRLVFEAPPMNLWDRFLGTCIACTAFKFRRTPKQSVHNSISRQPIRKALWEGAFKNFYMRMMGRPDPSAEPDLYDKVAMTVIAGGLIASLIYIAWVFLTL